MTTDEVAELLRMPVSSLRYWRHTGKGPASFKVGRRVLYARDDVHAFVSGAMPPMTELDWNDEMELARQADMERGYGLLREQRMARFEAANRAGPRTHPVAETIARAIEAEAEHEGPRAQRVFKMCAAVARRVGAAGDE